MKIIYIKGWTCTKSENLSCIKDFNVQEIVAEGGIINVDITLLNCSCDIDLLDSVYLTNKNTIVFGEAASSLDRSLEIAISSIKQYEEAQIVIEMEGKYVHEKVRYQLVILECKVKYSIVTNGKKPYEYIAKEILYKGKRYKDLALEKLNITSIKELSYKYPLELSVFFLLVRAIKWLSLISSNDLNSEEKEIYTVLRNQCYNNISHFHLSFENYEEAVFSSSIVLNHDHDNIKALFRRAVGQTNLQNYELASSDLRRIIEIEPSNKSAMKQMSIIAEKRRLINSKYSDAMKKFLAI